MSGPRPRHPQAGTEEELNGTHPITREHVADDRAESMSTQRPPNEVVARGLVGCDRGSSVCIDSLPVSVLLVPFLVPTTTDDGRTVLLVTAAPVCSSKDSSSRGIGGWPPPVAGSLPFPQP